MNENSRRNSTTAPETTKQSPGCDPKSSKRNSGLFAFFKWFKPSTSRESLDKDIQNSHSSSCDSLTSLQSVGTVASFSFLPPTAYNKNLTEKTINPGPETDTYKARLKQRDKRRENDKNTTLRKKYNLFFNRDTFLKNKTPKPSEVSSKSLPLITKSMMETQDPVRLNRTNSESSKIRKSGGYLHVKGKRKAPQPPPGNKQTTYETTSLRRRKKLAPSPPHTTNPTDVELKNKSSENTDRDDTIEYADADIIFNDSLKLDHGVLKPTKDADVSQIANNQNRSGDENPTDTSTTSARSSYVEVPVSPRPWYKRNSSRDSCVVSTKDQTKSENKYEPIEIHKTTKELNEETKHERKKEDKRKSGVSLLANISELDREASEILKKEQMKANSTNQSEMPGFMKIKEEVTKINTDNWVSPKKRSAKDLIAKFNAITNVTRVTVNTALFGGATKDKKDYFGRSHSNEERKQESILESHKKRIEMIDKKIHNAEANFKNPLAKSESASAVKKPETPKPDKKSWNCPKCYVSNDYWRIICHVCSAIKPYFDDWNQSSPASSNEKISSIAKDVENNIGIIERGLERSKTQIGFSVLASYNNLNQNKYQPGEKLKDLNKSDEREKLKKMLIEMKNSLPKKKFNNLEKVNQSNRTSVILENSESEKKEEVVKPNLVQERLGNEEKAMEEKTLEEKVAEIIIGTSETIYENIKVRKGNENRPIKVSSSAQTSSVIKKPEPKVQIAGIIKKKNSFEPMKVQDFEDIYGDKNGKTNPVKIYANLAQNDELSLFFNMPKNLLGLKNFDTRDINKDTIEINRLLKKLETAIGKGDLVEASTFAKQLAQLKVNCSVIRQKPSRDFRQAKKNPLEFSVDMYVEDKISHRGPFTLQVTENQTVAQLKKQVQEEFEIPANVQRWILGKELANDDNATLKENKVTNGCPIFLYLVASENNVKQLNKSDKPDKVSMPSTSTNIFNQEEVVPIRETDLKSEKIETFACDNILKTNVGNLDKIQNSKLCNVVITSATTSQIYAPKIVDVIPKIVETPHASAKMEEKNKFITSTELDIEEKPIPNVNSELDLPNATNIVIPKETKKVDVPQKAKVEEDFDFYESSTLKPKTKEWECDVCTLFNPMTSNICEVCGAVRQTDPPKPTKRKLSKSSTSVQNTDQTYLQLVNLDNTDLVSNVDLFECLVCMSDIAPYEGITLRECLHQFCKMCLRQTIEYSEEAQVKCPFRNAQYACNTALQDREIKALVSQVIYDQYLAKSVAEAENKMDKSFHCKTPDCRGWCIFEDNVNDFHCPVCRKTNCLTCQAIHMGANCKQYQERMNVESETDENAKRTKIMLNEMVEKGEAIACPTCQVIMMKKWGCDWLRCSMCKTEICWVTRGPRWGPAGKGDTSGGCRCGVNGVKCHPKCNYCH